MHNMIQSLDSILYGPVFLAPELKLPILDTQAGVAAWEGKNQTHPVSHPMV
jgi:hypothetical protein